MVQAIHHRKYNVFPLYGNTNRWMLYIAQYRLFVRKIETHLIKLCGKMQAVCG